MYQINNIKIKYVSSLPKDRRWQVSAPDGRLLEEFQYECDARHWAQDTKDFIKRKENHDR